MWRLRAGGVGLALLGSVAVAMPASSQSAPQRRALESFVDSVGRVTDPAVLTELESRLMQAAKRDRSSPNLHLTLGYLALRLGELLGGAHFDDAASELKWATQLAPQWPFAWYGLGLAEFAVGQAEGWNRDDRRFLLAKDAWARGTQALTRAVTLDPDFALRLESVAQAAFLSGEKERADAIREALRRAAGAARPGRSVGIQLSLGRLEADLGDTARAIGAFRAAAQNVEARARGLLEVARLELTLGSVDGIEPYFEAAALDDPLVIAEYHKDLEWIAQPRDLAAFDSLPPGDRAQFLWQFWTRRDRAGLRQNGERLREHYRRLALARARYPRLDDRARVLVRHGEPDSRATVRLAGLEPNESWRYQQPGGDLLLHFLARRDTTEYALVESIFDLTGADSDGGRPAGGDDDRGRAVRTEQVLRSRSQLSPFYQSAAASRRDQLAGFRSRERALGKASLERALATDSYPLRFTRDLAARVQLLTVGGDSNGPGLEVWYAVPGFAAEPIPVQQRFRYPVRLRLVAWDSSVAPLLAVDTVVSTMTNDRVASDDFVAGRVELRLPPGRHNIRLALQYGERAGTLVSRDTVTIGNPHPGEIVLSDLVLGGGRGLLQWTPSAGAPLPIDPSAAYSRADTLDLYVEATGLLPGSSGRARLFVSQLPAVGPNPRWHPWPGAADWRPVLFGPGPRSEMGSLRLRCPIKKLKPGTYELELVVDVGGQVVRRRSRLDVRDDGLR